MQDKTYQKINVDEVYAGEQIRMHGADGHWTGNVSVITRMNGWITSLIVDVSEPYKREITIHFGKAHREIEVLRPKLVPSHNDLIDTYIQTIVKWGTPEQRKDAILQILASL